MYLGPAQSLLAVAVVAAAAAEAARADAENAALFVDEPPRFLVSQGDIPDAFSKRNASDNMQRANLPSNKLHWHSKLQPFAAAHTAPLWRIVPLVLHHCHLFSPLARPCASPEASYTCLLKNVARHNPVNDMSPD